MNMMDDIVFIEIRAVALKSYFYVLLLVESFRFYLSARCLSVCNSRKSVTQEMGVDNKIDKIT